MDDRAAGSVHFANVAPGSQAWRGIGGQMRGGGGAASFELERTDSMLACLKGYRMIQVTRDQIDGVATCHAVEGSGAEQL